MTETKDFLAEAEALGPWWYRFEVGGQRIPGQCELEFERVATFFRWVGQCGGKVKTILEMGSHEGMQTCQLAKHPGVTRVLGIEGHEGNFRRSRFILDKVKAKKAEVRHENLEFFDPEVTGSFDAVFCAGLLYHLPEPWTLIEKLAGACRFLFLDTHYAPMIQVANGRFHGNTFNEGNGPLNGLSPVSFWLTYKDLTMSLMENGFVIRFVKDMEMGGSMAPRIWVLAEQVGKNKAGWDQQLT